MLNTLIDFAKASNNIGSFVAGFLVFIIGGFMVFLIREFFKKPPSFSGIFYLKTTTVYSAHKNYEGLSSFYMLTLINESSVKAIGKIEKFYDIERDGKSRIYTGRQRNIGDVILNVERYYLRPNKMNLHMTFHGDQNGEQRESSLVVALTNAKVKSQGVFSTTAADAHGDAIFQDNQFSEIDKT